MKARAILFDLHHTLTRTRESPLSLIRRISSQYGLDLKDVSDTEIQEAFQVSDKFLVNFQITQNVGPHWGGRPEHWIEADMKMFEALGITDVGSDIVLKIEEDFKHQTTHTDFEYLHEESLPLLRALEKRGLKLGICTRRHDNPAPLLERENIGDLFSAVTWSGVPGYAKPSPYTLFQAAEEIGINPLHCVFVGNLVSSDIEAAERAGMKSVLLTWANPEEAGKARETTSIRETPMELLNLLD